MAPEFHPAAENYTEVDLVEKFSEGGDYTDLPTKFILPEIHRPVIALTRSQNEIPVVDMAGLGEGAKKRAATLAAIHSACLEWGFFQVINHGVTPSVMDAMRRQVEAFLVLPIAERAPTGIRKGMASQGYGTGYVKPDTGARDWRDYFLLRTFPKSMRDYDCWPRSPAFREAIEDYTIEIKRLATQLLECFSINLGLPPNYIKESLGELHQDFLINHYPPCPKPELAIGANKHTDVGAVTCLWQLEDVVGLQVLKDEQWVPIKPLPEAFIINVGDMVEVVSNGIYKSITHRAIVNMSKRRVSIATFYDLHPDTMVRPAPQLIDADQPSKYAPIYFGHHAKKIAVETDKIGEKVASW